MKALIKNGQIIDPLNKIKEKSDILIENGKVVEIKKGIKVDSAYEIDAKGMIVSPGFVDLHANFCDPGATDREDLKTGSLAAVKGGITHIVLGTDNKPAPSESNVIDYIDKYKNIMPVNIYTSGAVTVDRLGYDVADINFLSNHGAVAFYDGHRPVADKNLLKKAMDIAKSKGKIISVYSENDSKVKVRGIIEGNVAKKLGIKGPVSLSAEAKDLVDNIAIAKLAEAKIDLAYVSSSESIEVLEESKDENVFAEVPALNLILTDKAVDTYGALAKVLPPLRSETERAALCTALKKGIIDIISSNHVPIEAKDKEGKLKDAKEGSIGLETMLGICGKALVDSGILNWKEVIEKISINPAKLYGLDKYGAGRIDIGKVANITIFSPNEKWKLEEEDIVSKSHNTPLIGHELIGKVKYTICNGKLVYKDKSLIKDETKNKANEEKKEK